MEYYIKANLLTRTAAKTDLFFRIYKEKESMISHTLSNTLFIFPLF